MKLQTITPGQILEQEFLVPLRVSQNALAREIGVPPARINELIHNRRTITADTAVRLSLFFGTSVEFWINLQARFDAKKAHRELRPALARKIKRFCAA